MSHYPERPKGATVPPPPPRKVFCADCKHFRWFNRCTSNPGDSWRAKGERYADPSEKNANNDCSEFEQYQYVEPPPPPEPPPLRSVTGHPPSRWWEFWK